MGSKGFRAEWLPRFFNCAVYSQESNCSKYAPKKLGHTLSNWTPILNKCPKGIVGHLGAFIWDHLCHCYLAWYSTGPVRPAFKGSGSTLARPRGSHSAHPTNAAAAAGRGLRLLVWSNRILTQSEKSQGSSSRNIAELKVVGEFLVAMMKQAWYVYTLNRKSLIVMAKLSDLTGTKNSFHSSFRWVYEK